ncbi:MAG: plasmid recombination protein, partial [Burkholderiaceae bacterium]
MANYAILRAEKLKTLGSIGASLSHNYRARETLNADPSRSHLNSHSMHGPQEVLDALKAALPAKRRKDAVLCIEYLVTCSPD